MSNKAIAVCVRIAVEAHQHQFRWDGTPYMNHIISVWNNVTKLILKDKMFVLSDRNFAIVQCCALLHDVVEDCMSADDLREKLKEIGDTEIEYLIFDTVVNELTHTKESTYDEYVGRISSLQGLISKYCDVQHNMGCSMQNIADNHDIERAAKQIKKYGSILPALTAKLNHFKD